MENALPLAGKRVVVTGGTGSLGQVLVRRLLAGELGDVEKVVVFSRDEAKQHSMRVAYLNRRVATDEIIYRTYTQKLEFRIGDVRSRDDVAAAISDADVLFNAAALKQVPTCEYFPYQAVLTNVMGPENIVRVIHERNLSIDLVVGISTDKACKPVNVMGMTKAIQERIFIQANMRCPRTSFICVRYGNVLASRGSVIPLFLDQINAGGPVTVTTKRMTRFLLSLDEAVDTVFAAVRGASPGETYVPRVPSARVFDIATTLVGSRSIPIEVTGIRPGEKIHEILVSEEECQRTLERDGYYVIQPVLPELQGAREIDGPLEREYSSADEVIVADRLGDLLRRYQLLGEGDEDSTNAPFPR